MTKNKALIAGLILCLAAGSTTVHAQAKTCRTRLVLDALYQKALGGGKYEYYLHIRNSTDQPLNWQLNFRDLPSGVRAERTQLSSETPLPAHGSKAIRFATGTNANVNLTTVSVGYDVNGKSITASNCSEETQ